MRRLQAIALLVILSTAPLAMVAQGASLARQEQQMQWMAQRDDCAHMGLGFCGCQRGPMAALNLLVPMPNMVLPHAAQLPDLTVQCPSLRSSGSVVPLGYTPVEFHPPRS